MDIQDFIKKARKIHGNRYDYSKVYYRNNRTKVCIICPEHGEFWQIPHNHLRGVGCPECKKEQLRKKNTSNTEDFIQKARVIHGNKYDYSKAQYINCITKVCIICPEHGEFWQRPSDHLCGKGCIMCSRNSSAEKQSSNTEDFIKKARKIHGNKYDYSKVQYINSSTKVCIICSEHGEFWQIPSSHLQGVGCPKCSCNQKSGTDEFIAKSKKVHGNKYDYSKVEYVNNSTKVCIVCPEHGEFWQRPNNHLRGDGCPECSIISRAKQRTSSIEYFIKKAKRIHGDKYDYSKTEYIDCHTKVCIICPEHGEFWQSPDGHLQGHGCSKCASTTSNPEDEINNFINEVCGIETKTRDRSFLNKRLECDILVPSCKLAIEFNGLYWHSEAQGKDKNYHLHKTELAESKGYHLIHIFEDEWMEHKDIVLNKIRHFLGKDEEKPVVGARKCTVKTISKTLAEPFLTTYHIQGFVGSTAYYGAFYGDILVGVMTFKQEKPNMWNLTRFATNTDYRLPGLASKMFKQFVKDNNPMEVKTFLDRRWSHGDVNVYDRMGFKLTETLAPDYRYVVKNQRLHKFGFRKQILHKKYGLPLSMTEKEMTEQLGFYRIWDCGLYKYVWRKE